MCLHSSVLEMFQDINKDWMDEYELTYQKYKIQWDYHYQEVRKFILSCIPKKIGKLGFIGVTSNLPELNSEILVKIKDIVLLDIYEEGMYKAKEHLQSNFSYENVKLEICDITLGFVDLIAGYFREYQKEKITEEDLFFKLKTPKFNYREYFSDKFDFVVHTGLMDYYMMPLFIQHCQVFIQKNDKFHSLMKNLNDIAVKISLKAMYSMLSDNGRLVISSPISRHPIGDNCSRSLFWLKSLEENIVDSGFIIKKKSKHIWEEFPEKGGHSHTILNVYCTKA